MMKSRKTKPRSLIALKSGGYGDFEPVFRQVATDDAMLYIADLGIAANREMTIGGARESRVEVESRKKQK